MSDVIAISAGSEEWKAWYRHVRGTKTAARMERCEREGRPFFVVSPFPPSPESSRRRDADRLKQVASVHRRGEKVLADALEAVAQNNAPDISGRDDLGIIEIVDPSEEVELVATGRGAPMMLRKPQALPRRRIISLRNDPVGMMEKRGHLGDATTAAARIKAARVYENLHERTEIGKVRSIDVSRTKVDGGRFNGPDIDGAGVARVKLDKIDAALGREGRDIVQAVLVRKIDIKTLAAERGAVSKRDILYLGRRFGECLDTIGSMIGTKQKSRGEARHRDSHAEMAHYAEIGVGLHQAVQLARITPKLQTRRP